MNNRKLIKSIIKEYKKATKVIEEDISPKEYSDLMDSYKIAKAFFENRFEATLKQYNYDKERAYDDYILEKLMLDFSNYGKFEYSLASEVIGDESASKAVAKNLRTLHNHIHLSLQGKL